MLSMLGEWERRWWVLRNGGGVCCLHRGQHEAHGCGRGPAVVCMFHKRSGWSALSKPGGAMLPYLEDCLQGLMGTP
jgi:hypothetical protein